MSCDCQTVFGLNLFQIAAEANKPEPNFLAGDTCWVVRADKVFTATVERNFEVTDFENIFKEYGYSLRGPKISTVLWDRSINNGLFFNKTDAIKKAKENESLIEYFEFPSFDKILSSRFERGTLFSRAKNRFAILYDNNVVVWKDFLTYTFAKVFPTLQQAKKYYEEVTEVDFSKNDFDICSSCPFDDSAVYEDIQSEKLYYCTTKEGVKEYSSLEYFFHNYFDCKYDFIKEKK